MPRKPHPENETETLLGITAAEDDISERHVRDAKSEDGLIMFKVIYFTPFDVICLVYLVQIASLRTERSNTLSETFPNLAQLLAPAREIVA